MMKMMILQAIINISLTDRVNVTKLSSKFVQLIDAGSNTVFGCGFADEKHLNTVGGVFIVYFFYWFRFVPCRVCFRMCLWLTHTVSTFEIIERFWRCSFGEDNKSK